MANIQINQQQLEAFKNRLEGIRNGFEKAANRSINRTATSTKTLAAKEIGRKVTLKAKFIKGHFSVIKSSPSTLSATIRISHKKAQAVKFQNRKLKKGVSVKFFRDSPAEKYRHAFKAEMPSGHVGIFYRLRNNSRYDGRLPIAEIFGPSVVTVFENTQGLRDQVLENAASTLLTEMERQTNYIISQQAT